MYFGLVDKDDKLMRIATSYDTYGEDKVVEYNISNDKTLPVFTATTIDTAKKVCNGEGEGSMIEPFCVDSEVKVVQLAINITASY